MPVPPRGMRDVKTFSKCAHPRFAKVRSPLRLRDEHLPALRYASWCGIRLIEERLLAIRKEKRRLADIARELRGGSLKQRAKRAHLLLGEILKRHHARPAPAEPFFVKVCRKTTGSY